MIDSKVGHASKVLGRRIKLSTCLTTPLAILNTLFWLINSLSRNSTSGATGYYQTAESQSRTQSYYSNATKNNT